MANECKDYSEAPPRGSGVRNHILRHDFFFHGMFIFGNNCLGACHVFGGIREL